MEVRGPPPPYHSAPPPRQHTESACESAPVSIGELQEPAMPAEPAEDNLVSWTTTPNAVELLPLPPLPACPSTCASWVQVPADLPVDDAVPSPLTPLGWLASPSQSQPEVEYSPSPVGPPEDRRCVQEDVLPLQTAQKLSTVSLHAPPMNRRTQCNSQKNRGALPSPPRVDSQVSKTRARSGSPPNYRVTRGDC